MMHKGSKVRVVAARAQGRRFQNQSGVVMDSTRSLATHRRVYFVHLPSACINVWFAEEQIALEAEC